MNSFFERFSTATKKAVVTCDCLAGFFHGQVSLNFKFKKESIYIITRVLVFESDMLLKHHLSKTWTQTTFKI